MLSGPPSRSKVKVVSVVSGLGSVSLTMMILPATKTLPTFTLSQRHFELVLGRVSTSPVQDGFWVVPAERLLSQLTQLPMSSLPSASLSTHSTFRVSGAPN